MAMTAVDGIDQTKLDRGRSWFVLFAAFVTFIFTSGSTLTLGTLFQPVTERIHATTGQQVSTWSLTLLFALVVSIMHIVGFLAAAVTALVGYRATIALGSIMAIIGFGLSALATQMWHLYLSMGVLVGTGFGFSYTPAIGVLSYYFSKRYFSLVGGVATSGSSVGIMTLSRIRPALHASLSWPMAMLVEAGFSILLMTSAIAIKRPDVKSKKRPVVVEGKDAPYVTAVTVPSNRVRRLSSSSLSTLSSSRSPTTQHALVVAHHQRLSLPSSSFAKPEDDTLTFEDDILAKRNSIDMNGQALQKLRNLSIRADDAAAVKALKKQKRGEVFNRLFRPVLFKNGAFYLLMIEATCILANSIFLVLTPGYLTGTQGWSSTKSAGTVLTIYGATALFSRFLVIMINIRPAIGSRVPKTAQIAFGIALAASASTEFLLAPTNAKVKGVVHNSGALSNNGTSAALHSAAAPSVRWLDEPNAWLFTIFAAVCGFSASFVIAYQPPLLHEVLPPEYLTTAFGYENVVLGVLNLALTPMAGIFADAFGTLRYAYAICLCFSVVSASALIGVVILLRVRARRAAAQEIMMKNVKHPTRL